MGPKDDPWRVEPPQIIELKQRNRGRRQARVIRIKQADGAVAEFYETAGASLQRRSKR